MHLASSQTRAFTIARAVPPSRQRRVACKASSGGGGGSSSSSDNSSSGEASSTGLGLKAVWVGAEAFGNVVGATKGDQQQQRRQQQQGGAPMSREQAIASIKEDYAKNYFISGKWLLLGRGSGPVDVRSSFS